MLRNDVANLKDGLRNGVADANDVLRNGVADANDMASPTEEPSPPCHPRAKRRISVE